MKTYFTFGVTMGIISAGITTLYFCISFLLGVNPLGGSKVISYFLMLVMFFVVLWFFRTKKKEGILHFHQGMAVVLVEHLVACVVFALFVWLCLQFLIPDLLIRHIAESKKFLLFIKADYVKTVGENAFQQGMKDLDALTPFSVAFDEFKKRFFILLFFSLVASFIMRRSPNWSLSK